MKLRKIILKGFKKFKDFTLEFNDKKTVIVGENEAGKSTILEAIDLVLNQNVFRNPDSSMIKYLNTAEVQYFFDHPCIGTLPKIIIEIHVDFLNNAKGIYFSGLHYENPTAKTREGIRFTYEFDNDFSNLININEFAQKKILPIEYYKASWTTFRGAAFKKQMIDLNYIFLDNSSNKNDLYGSYARRLFVAKIEDENKRTLSSAFNVKIKEFLDNNSQTLNIDNNKKIGIDVSKSNIINLIDIYEGDISIQNMGKGRENLIKTELSLNDRVFDLVLIEEPENHLSHSNVKKLINVIDEATNEQLIITSHNSLVVGRLDLKNVVWISENNACKLDQLDEEVSKYFSKVDNVDILRFILSKKVILVEGAAEYIMLPKMFEQVIGQSIEHYGVEVISMGSISYSKYKEIASQLQKKVAVIFDNDKNQNNIAKMEREELFSTFCSEDISEWTLEVALYKSNEEFFDSHYESKRTRAEYNGQQEPKALAHMLKNKTDNAIEVELNINKINIPSYIKDAVEWIVK